MFENDRGMPDERSDSAFSDFVREVGPRLKQSLMAALGGEQGRDAAAEALSWAWEHWDRVGNLSNPAGYLYRLARNRSVSSFRRRRPPILPPASFEDNPLVEPVLDAALARLSERQRTVVLLIHGFGWTYEEVADHMQLARGTVQTHMERAMRKLRSELGVEQDA